MGELRRPTAQLSLLDTPDYKIREWYVVYHKRDACAWWGKYLKPEFRHVELARSVQYGPGVNDVMWQHMLPTYEMLDVELSLDPTAPWARCPDSTVQKVTAARRLGTMRSWFDFGPPTCVEVVKMALGIRAFWVRTPYQLYRYIAKHNGVLISQ